MTKSTMSRGGRGFARASFVTLTLGALIASTVFADSKSSEGRLRTDLAGGAISGRVPSGHADFRSESDRNRSRLNVEVEDVNLADGTVLDVMVSHGGASTKVGVIHLQAGRGELELNTQDGDTVPAIVKSDAVTVSNAGSPILMGVF
jgi:hypothetical protein